MARIMVVLFQTLTVAINVFIAEGSQCGANVLNHTGECFDATLQAWLPSNQLLCGANFGLPDQQFSLDLPGLELASNLTRQGSDLWLEAEELGLKAWVGCGNHPGLVNGSSYCAQTSSTFDLGDILGDWGVLEGLTPVACYAYSLEESLVSISFDPPLSTEFLLPGFPVVLKLFGYTFAPNAEVPLFDYIGADLQLKSGETLKTHLALSGVVEVALGIPFIFELVMPIEGVFGMYLDFGAGTVAQPYKILESLVLWKTSGSGGLHFYMSGTLYHATSLSQLIGGLPDLGVACTVDFFPKAVKDSPFCNAEDTMEDEPEVGIYFTVESGKTVADVRAWGMWLAIKVDSTSGSLTLCKDGECSQEFCIWDSQCIPGYHCCKSTLEFTCQKIYKHSLLGTDLSCLELPAAQAAGYAVDPECAGACDETSAALRRAGTVTAVMTLILLFLKW